jgi:hypothetical protein
MKRAAVLLLVASHAAAPAAVAQDPPPAPAPGAPAAPAAPAKPDAKAAKREKVKKALALLLFRENILASFDAAFDQQKKMGAPLPDDFSEKFKKAADFDELERIVVDIYEEVFDDEVLDGLIAFLQTPAGKKFAGAQGKLQVVTMERIQPWAMQTAMKAMMEGGGMEMGGEDGEEVVDEVPGKPGAAGEPAAAKFSANESTAIATLRNLASCQAQIQTSGKIDCDRDGIGEYGTFLELTGSTEVRTVRGEGGASNDFSARGTIVNPPILSPRLAGVDGAGIVVKSGYCFRIFLPDSASPAGWVSEAGPKDAAGLAGGSGKVGTDMSETTWCAYAWPEAPGESGGRVFFVNQAGDVLQSANVHGKHAGKERPVPAHAAFRGAGITSEVAVGTAGRDGDVWKVTN